MEIIKKSVIKNLQIQGWIAATYNYLIQVSSWTHLHISQMGAGGTEEIVDDDPPSNSARR